MMEENVTVKGILTTLFKHKSITILVLCLGVVLLAVFAVFFAPSPKYSASSLLMVRFGREFVQVSEAGNQSGPTISPDTIINTEIQILTSRDLVGEVVKRLGPERLYPSLAKMPMSSALRREYAILMFSRYVSAKRAQGTSNIEVSFQHENPYAAAKALSLLIELFKDKHLQVFSEPKTPFLEEQLKAYQNELTQSEARMLDFSQRNRVFSVDQEKTILIQQKASIESILKAEQIRLDELKQRLAYSKQRKDVLQDQNSITPLRQELNTLLRREQELSEKYVDSSLTMRNIRRDIALLKEQLERSTDQAHKAEVGRAEAELQPQEIRVNSLRKQLAETEGRIQKMDLNASRFNDLRREVSIADNNYQTYLRKVEEARISEDMAKKKMSNISVVQEPSIPIKPDKNSGPKILAMGLLLVFGLAFGLPFLLELLSSGLTSPADAERKLGLPVMVSVPMKKAM